MKLFFIRIAVGTEEDHLPLPRPIAAQNSHTLLSRTILTEMSTKDLRGILGAYDIDTSNCVERSNFMQLLEECPEVVLTD